MTPGELSMIEADGRAVVADAERFGVCFYETLFELAPHTRSMFSDDLVAQRGKLVDEIGFLIAAAGAGNGADGLDDFVERARELGRRHVGYGVTGHDYGVVGAALQAALAEIVPDWDETHVRTWETLYRLISDVMREGARGGYDVPG